ncbi:hypothetical protein AQUCO_169500001v1 [Aquilegia coerulea]|uniref:Uncharacterized protein n=1 Tax=Aquilegia coerulea TaxID=218851 RepID=A0A2G5C055_AQUCA|nr:hypothetical protein AQUCO_169500001v1 [Aquilegia coerulea]
MTIFCKYFSAATITSFSIIVTGSDPSLQQPSEELTLTSSRLRFNGLTSSASSLEPVLLTDPPPLPLPESDKSTSTSSTSIWEKSNLRVLDILTDFGARRASCLVRTIFS